MEVSWHCPKGVEPEKHGHFASFCNLTYLLINEPKHNKQKTSHYRLYNEKTTQANAMHRE